MHISGLDDVGYKHLVSSYAYLKRLRLKISQYLVLPVYINFRIEIIFPYRGSFADEHMCFRADKNINLPS